MKGTKTIKPILVWTMSVVLGLLFVLNVALGVALSRRNNQVDFVQQRLDHSFRFCFCQLAEHLNTKYPEDETEQALWLKEIEHLSNQCLEHYVLTSYDENKELQGVILLLRSMAMKWEEYPSGLISRELAKDLLEVAYRLPDSGALLTQVHEALKQIVQP